MILSEQKLSNQQMAQGSTKHLYFILGHQTTLELKHLEEYICTISISVKEKSKTYINGPCWVILRVR